MLFVYKQTLDWSDSVSDLHFQYYTNNSQHYIAKSIWQYLPRLKYSLSDLYGLSQKSPYTSSDTDYSCLGQVAPHLMIPLHHDICITDCFSILKVILILLRLLKKLDFLLLTYSFEAMLISKSYQFYTIIIQ